MENSINSAEKKTLEWEEDKVSEMLHSNISKEQQTNRTRTPKN